MDAPVGQSPDRDDAPLMLVPARGVLQLSPACDTAAAIAAGLRAGRGSEEHSWGWLLEGALPGAGDRRASRFFTVADFRWTCDRGGGWSPDGHFSKVPCSNRLRSAWSGQHAGAQVSTMLTSPQLIVFADCRNAAQHSAQYSMTRSTQVTRS
jgi:hypothetical protein